MLPANCTILLDNRTPGVSPQIATQVDPPSEDREPRVLMDPGIQQEQLLIVQLFF